MQRYVTFVEKDLHKALLKIKIILKLEIVKQQYFTCKCRGAVRSIRNLIFNVRSEIPIYKIIGKESSKDNFNILEKKNWKVQNFFYFNRKRNCKN